MLWMVLWLFTSSYAVPIGQFPMDNRGVYMCASTAVRLSETLKKAPRPFLFKLACLPTLSSNKPFESNRPSL